MIKLLAAAALVVLFTLLSFQVARADHFVWLPDDPARFPVQSRLMERGYLNYCFDNTAYNYPGFRAQAAEVVDAAFGANGVRAYEVAAGPSCDVYNTMPPYANFPCGSGAAACIMYWLDPVVIYYNVALGYSNWRSGMAHEGVANSGHLLWQHERYKDQVQPFQCDPFATYTTMSCGNGVWQVTEWDRNAQWNAFVPDAPCPRGFVTGNDWTTISWGSVRCDGGVAHLWGIARNTNATRMSFGWQAPDSDVIRWAGELCGPSYNYCYSDYSDGSRGFDSFWTRPGACFFVRTENAALWWVPQISAPNFWTWVGCS